jgi:hypothetical protein
MKKIISLIAIAFTINMPHIIKSMNANVRPLYFSDWKLFQNEKDAVKTTAVRFQGNYLTFTTHQTFKHYEAKKTGPITIRMPYEIQGAIKRALHNDATVYLEVHGCPHLIQIKHEHTNL